MRHLKLIFLDLIYEKLVSMMVGSYYVTLNENVKTVNSFSQDILTTSKNIGLLICFKITLKYLLSIYFSSECGIGKK